MKYLDEFRDQNQAHNIAAAIANETRPDRDYRIMEFCGGHTHAIFRYGVQDLMPNNVQFVHGPGCPVCVLPIARLEAVMQMLRQYHIILCTYGDMMRVPGVNRRSLLQARAEGADIRMVYSTTDALQIARDHSTQAVVFFAIGFETTTPATAVAIKQAQAEGLKNFSVMSNHVLTPAALGAILNAEQPVAIDGLLGPSHVSSIIGSQPYEHFAQHYQKPIVVAGFEPLDVMQSTLMCIRLLNQGRNIVENEYTRVVTHAGNRKAQALIQDVFEIRDTFEWRGLGQLKNSALQIRQTFAEFDAERRFPVEPDVLKENKACECPAILRGQKRPTDCKLFGNGCTPASPIGSCMVSSEGACAAYWSYAGFRVPANNKQYENLSG
ncbi:MAG: hydrogenase formation protein HypD [Gammaproteobacteria bacterium]|nr:hydrogenase formation protein HypD [Gammaproteobacteria bacterium]MDH5731876.1 hydrogenase formation protein HypD [Gammaproteobacteria bacterium]